MTETRTATAADAELILKLYDLRREPELRKARNFVIFQCWPASFEEVKALLMDRGSDNNRYWRQACSYYDMACSLVARGALNADLFYDSNGESWFLFAKVKPFLAQIREITSPEFLLNVERVVEASPQGRARLAALEQRVKAMASAKK